MTRSITTIGLRSLIAALFGKNKFFPIYLLTIFAIRICEISSLFGLFLLEITNLIYEKRKTSNVSPKKSTPWLIYKDTKHLKLSNSQKV